MTSVLNSIRRRRIFRLPTVYPPQHDSFLLIRALEENPIPAGSRVLDLCTGSGIVALAAAHFEPDRIVAVDVSWPAVLSTRINAAIRDVDIEAVHGHLAHAVARGPFDVVLTNPPYVPCAAESTTLRSRKWDAGPTGRLVLDPLCAGASRLLADGGFMLVVHSEFSGERATLESFRRAGLHSTVVARARIPFGPVLTERRKNGCLPATTRDNEELVVVRADKSA